MRKASAFMAACLFSYGSANAQDVIVNHYEIWQQCRKFTMNYGVIKDANTMEGRALIANAEKLTGLNLNPRNIAIGMIPVYGMNTGERELHPNIKSPTGYTICAAAPSFIYTSRLNPDAGIM